MAGGELFLQPESGNCRTDASYASFEYVRLLCDPTSDVEDLAFVLDKRYPLTRSRWTGRIRQRRQRTVCTEYATQNGRRVCVRSRTETYEVMTNLSGPLTFTRRTS
ncbi:MAG: hypothetical protein ACT4P7_07235 [Gemmatimonadaceae bacterium]